MFGGDEVRQEASYQVESEKLPEAEELLMKNREVLAKKIDKELLLAKKNSRKNRQVALQALRRKKWYQKHLKYIDCAVKAVKSAHEHINTVNKVNDLIKDIAGELDGTQDMSDTLHASMCSEVEFDEDELLAELERLEKDVDESLCELDRVEERVSCPELSSTASPSDSAKTEEDEIEEELEYLRRWLNEPS